MTTTTTISARRLKYLGWLAQSRGIRATFEPSGPFIAVTVYHPGKAWRASLTFDQAKAYLLSL